MIGRFLIFWFILFAILRIIYEIASDKKFWGASNFVKFIITFILLSAAGLPGIWLFYYLNLRTFSKEDMTTGVLVHLEKHTKAASVYRYEYKLGDSVFDGYIKADKYLELGDTVDVIYNKESRSYSYSPSDKCYPLIGNFGFNMRFKKYLDKVQTENSQHKYIGN